MGNCYRATHRPAIPKFRATKRTTDAITLTKEEYRCYDRVEHIPLGYTSDCNVGSLESRKDAIDEKRPLS